MSSPQDDFNVSLHIKDLRVVSGERFLGVNAYQAGYELRGERKNGSWLIAMQRTGSTLNRSVTSDKLAVSDLPAKILGRLAQHHDRISDPLVEAN